MGAGKNVKHLREKNGFTQSDLARISGIDEKYISAIEREARNPGNRTIEKLAEAFGVAEREIKYGPEEKETPQVPEHLRRLFEEISKVFPDTYSLTEKSEKLSKVMRDLREGEAR